MVTLLRVSSAASAVLLVCLGLGVSHVHAAGEQAQQFTPEFRQIHTSQDPKHTPKIVAPDSVNRGEWFNVTVSAGVGRPHPSLSDHALRDNAVYQVTVETARAFLRPSSSTPTITF